MRLRSIGATGVTGSTGAHFGYVNIYDTTQQTLNSIDPVTFDTGDIPPTSFVDQAIISLVSSDIFVLRNIDGKTTLSNNILPLVLVLSA